MQGFSSWGKYKKIFLVILIAAIFVRLFVTVYLPDEAFSDSFYHLTISEFVAGNGEIPFSGVWSEPSEVNFLFLSSIPPPFYYIFLANFLLLAGLPFQLGIIKFFPIFLTVLQIVLSFIVLRKLFKDDFVFGLAFVLINPLLIIYSAINYTELIGSVLILASFYLYLKFTETSRAVFLLPAVFTLAAAAASKLNATIIIPAFAILLFYEFFARKKIISAKKLASVLALLVLLSSSWFALSYMQFGTEGIASYGEITDLGEELPAIFANPADFVVEFNSGFWSFPSEVAFSQFSFTQQLPYGLIFAVFALISLPILIFILFYLLEPLLKVFKSLRKRSLTPTQKICLLVLLAFAFEMIIFLKRRPNYGRTLIPMLPLLAIPFTYGLLKLKNVNIKKIITVLFVLVSIYSLSYTALFTTHYSSIYQQHLPLYAEISELPEDAVIVIHTNRTRAVRFVADRLAFSYVTSLLLDEYSIGDIIEPGKTDTFHLLPREINEIYENMPPEKIMNKLEKSGITHVADTCFKKTLGREKFAEMENLGYFEKIYSDECSDLYYVNYASVLK